MSLSRVGSSARRVDAGASALRSAARVGRMQQSDPGASSTGFTDLGAAFERFSPLLDDAARARFVQELTPFVQTELDRQALDLFRLGSREGVQSGDGSSIDWSSVSEAFREQALKRLNAFQSSAGTTGSSTASPNATGSGTAESTGAADTAKTAGTAGTTGTSGKSRRYFPKPSRRGAVALGAGGLVASGIVLSWLGSGDAGGGGGGESGEGELVVEELQGVQSDGRPSPAEVASGAGSRGEQYGPFPSERRQGGSGSGSGSGNGRGVSVRPVPSPNRGREYEIQYGGGQRAYVSIGPSGTELRDANGEVVGKLSPSQTAEAYGMAQDATKEEVQRAARKLVALGGADSSAERGVQDKQGTQGSPSAQSQNTMWLMLLLMMIFMQSNRRRY